MINTTQETYNLFNAFRNMQMALLYFNDIMKSNRVTPEVKDKLRVMKNRLDVNVRDFRLLVPSEHVSIIDEQMLDYEVVMQIDNIDKLLSEIPKEGRDYVEGIVEGLHEEFKKSTAPIL